MIWLEMSMHGSSDQLWSTDGYDYNLHLDLQNQLIDGYSDLVNYQ